MRCHRCCRGSRGALAAPPLPSASIAAGAAAGRCEGGWKQGRCGDPSQAGLRRPALGHAPVVARHLWLCARDDGWQGCARGPVAFQVQRAFQSRRGAAHSGNEERSAPAPRLSLHPCRVGFIDGLQLGGLLGRGGYARVFKGRWKGTQVRHGREWLLHAAAVSGTPLQLARGPTHRHPAAHCRWRSRWQRPRWAQTSATTCGRNRC